MSVDSSKSARIDAMPIVRDLKDFDPKSGGAVERLIFNHRLLILLFTLVVSVLLGWQGSKLVINGSFDRLIPQNHPYIKN